MLSHQIKTTLKGGGSTWIPLMELLSLIQEAVEEYDNTASRRCDMDHLQPKWIPIDQLAEWLDNSDKLSHVDIYSLLSKTLGFVSYYSTPQIHKGLCIVATDPQCSEEGETYNEIFISSVAHQGVMDNNGGKIAERIMDNRLQIGKLTEDILENHSKPNLDQRKLTWIHDKTRLESIIASWFSSNGYLPNSSQTSPEWVKMEGDFDTAPVFKPPLPSGHPPGAQAAKANPKATTVQIPLQTSKLPSASIKLPDHLVWPLPWSEQNSLAQDDVDQPTQNRQQTHYADSQAGAS